MNLKGIIPAMVTPADDEGRDIDLGRTRALARHLIDSGVDGLLVAGSTGEGPLLTREQRQALVEAVVKEAKGLIPVLAGVGSPATAQSVLYAKDAEAAGASGVAPLPVHFVRVNDDELYGYFAAIADSVAKPTLLYNFPRLTSGQNIPPAVAARLFQDKRVIGIKDSSGDLQNMKGYQDACGPDFLVFTGDESHLVDLLSVGGAGTICAAANIIPTLLGKVWQAFQAGDAAAARELLSRANPLRDVLGRGTFPAAVKAGCGLIGCLAGAPFAPVCPLGQAERARLADVLQNLKS